MSVDQDRVRIAINVMRARLTIVGFNLTIVTFQLSSIRRLAGGIETPLAGRIVHVSADTALLLAVALSVAAMVLFITASSFDSTGYVGHPAVIAGDLCMYLALAQSVTGFFEPLLATLRVSFEGLPPGDVALLTGSLIIAGGAGWFLAFFVGPIVSLVRSPFKPSTTAILAVIYVGLVVAISTIAAIAAVLEETPQVARPFGLVDVLHQFARPVHW